MKINTRIVILIINSLLNLCFLIYTFIVSGKNSLKLFLFLTVLNFIACTFYLILVLIIEVSLKQDCYFYKLLTFRIQKYLFCICGTVLLSYWIYSLMGPDIINWVNTTSFYFSTIYMHLIIGISMIYEMLSNSDRKHLTGVFYKDLIVSTVLMVSYSTVLVCVSKLSNIKVYPFLDKPINQVFGYLIISFINFYVCYLLFYSISRRRNKGKIRDLHEINEYKSPKETNNNYNV